jgi:hypothetical protein
VISAGESMQGGESSLEERGEEGHTCGVNFPCYTWFARGQCVYIHGF